MLQCKGIHIHNSTMIALFPIGLAVWFYGRKTQLRRRDELSTVTKVADQLIELIAPKIDD